jgi:hypothetical protein
MLHLFETGMYKICKMPFEILNEQLEIREHPVIANNEPLT